MNKPQKPKRQGQNAGRNFKRRPRPNQGERRHNPPIPLNADGVPTAVPDAPKPSGVVSVRDASLEKYPWLPSRVIAGSVWRGPAHERVRVDDAGNAVPL